MPARVDAVTAIAAKPIGRPTAALAGALSAGVALGVGELVAGARGAGPSLVTAIGTEFIDRFAGSLKDLAVTLFGTNDKLALVVGIVITSLVLGAVFGVVARRVFWAGAAGFVMFGVLGLWAYQRDPLGSPATGVVAAVAAVVVGIGALALLLRLAGRAAATAGKAPVVVDGVAAGGGITWAPRAANDPRSTPRRAFIAGAVVVGAGAASTAIIGRRLRATATAEAARRAVTIPAAATPRSRLSDQPFSVPGLSPYITPNADFYRIDTALTIPQINPEGWHLDISGRVDRPYSLTYDELLALDAVEETITLQCVSNEVGGSLVDNAVWQGVPLAALLERAGVQPEATQIVGRSADRWTAGFPTELATDGRVALVAYAMNGEPLPSRHGFPARLVVAGLYGYVSATKWLTEIELTTWDEFDGYWISRGWAKEGPIKTMSRIDVPRTDVSLSPGRTPIAGVAWAPTRGISRVEVRIDDDDWQSCRLGDVASENTWVQWLYEWEATPGEHTIVVRATDGDGVTQTDQVSSPAPDGATGWHARRVRVDTT
jgi:DMSO/TMAO reductase YedYZ molybdopterin-dependent catalytic subunit